MTILTLEKITVVLGAICLVGGTIGLTWVLLGGLPAVMVAVIWIGWILIQGAML